MPNQNSNFGPLVKLLNLYVQVPPTATDNAVCTLPPPPKINNSWWPSFFSTPTPTPINPVQTAPVEKCALCGKKETETLKLKRCGACKKIKYCSGECQKKDWHTHKQTCGK